MNHRWKIPVVVLRNLVQCEVMDTSNLKNLPTDQKIELVFRLWDEIADSDAPIVLVR